MNTMVKLSASNHSIWKPMMEDVLYCKDLHDPIEGDVPSLVICQIETGRN